MLLCTWQHLMCAGHSGEWNPPEFVVCLIWGFNFATRQCSLIWLDSAWWSEPRHRRLIRLDVTQLWRLHCIIFATPSLCFRLGRHRLLLTRADVGRMLGNLTWWSLPPGRWPAWWSSAGDSWETWWNKKTKKMWLVKWRCDVVGHKRWVCVCVLSDAF